MYPCKLSISLGLIMFVSAVTFSAPLQEFTGVHVAATTAAAKSVTYELQLDESVV